MDGFFCAIRVPNQYVSWIPPCKTYVDFVQEIFTDDVTSGFADLHKSGFVLTDQATTATFRKFFWCMCYLHKELTSGQSNRRLLFLSSCAHTCWDKRGA